MEGRDVLRRAAPDAADPLEMACFPLVPYANRIAHGRFSFADREHRVPLNFGDHPHSLHGLGWHRPWDVAEAGRASARLTHTHDGGPGWPWRYRAEQVFSLGGAGLRAELIVTSEDADPMPAGLGFHPYFPSGRDTRLRMRARQVWLADKSVLPTVPASAGHFGDWAAGAEVARDDVVDHAYEDWDGEAAISQDGDAVRLAALGASHLHLYIPPGGGFFCAEPVTHLPDALNRGFKMDVLAPGETLRLVMKIGLVGA